MRQILLIEDDRDLRESLIFLLQDEGYQTREAATQGEALALLNTTPFDLILTDLLTHDQTRPLASAVTLRGRVAPTPVAILTAWSAAADSADAPDFAFVMAKPFDLDMLLTAIAAALHQTFSPEEDQRAQVIYQYFAALSAQDWDALVSLCTDDVIYVLPGSSPLSVTIEGKAAFRSYTEEVFANFPAARFDQVNVYATPGGMAARYQSHWLGNDQQEQVQSGAVIFQFDGLKIQQIGVRLDITQLRHLMQTSSNPPPEA